LKLDDIQVLLEMKENVFYVTWMYWRTNSILFCNVQSIMICVKNTSRNIMFKFKFFINFEHNSSSVYNVACYNNMIVQHIYIYMWHVNK
jgi:hypothetical protein